MVFLLSLSTDLTNAMLLHLCWFLTSVTDLTIRHRLLCDEFNEKLTTSNGKTVIIANSGFFLLEFIEVLFDVTNYEESTGTRTCFPPKAFNTIDDYPRKP